MYVVVIVRYIGVVFCDTVYVNLALHLANFYGKCTHQLLQKKWVTSGFLASVEKLFVALPVLESILCVTDASSVLIRFTVRPVSIRRRVAVLPDISSSRCSHQAEPVILRVQRRSVSTTPRSYSNHVVFMSRLKAAVNKIQQISKTTIAPTRNAWQSLASPSVQSASLSSKQ